MMSKSSIRLSVNTRAQGRAAAVSAILQNGNISRLSNHLLSALDDGLREPSVDVLKRLVAIPAAEVDDLV